MAMSNTMPSLHVEGTDDQHSIMHLLQRNGISFNPRPVDIHVEKSDRELLKAIPVAIKTTKNRSIGFVIDIDTTLASRCRRFEPELTPSPMNLTSGALKAPFQHHFLKMELLSAYRRTAVRLGFG